MGNLPNPGMDFTPFDTLPAASLDDLVENIEALKTGAASVDAISYATTALANPYKFSVYQNSSQNLTGGFVATKVNLQAEEFDTNNNFDSTTNYRYVVPVSGFYSFGGAITVTVGNNVVVYSSIFKNGAELKRGNFISNNTGGNQTVTSTCGIDNVQLAASDYIELFAAQSQAGVAGMSGTAALTYLSGHKLSTT